MVFPVSTQTDLSRVTEMIGKRIACVGIAVDEAAIVQHRLDDPVMCDHGAKGRVARRETLRHGQDVGRNIPVLGREEPPGAAAARHHLVVDQQLKEDPLHNLNALNLLGEAALVILLRQQTILLRSTIIINLLPPPSCRPL